MRLWRDPNERSIYVLVLAVTALVAIGVAARFGLPDATRYEVLKVAFPCVAVAAAYRTKVHLDEHRDHVALGADPEAVLVVVAELRRLVHQIEQLEPCPTPACMDMRHRLLVAIRRLPDHAALEAAVAVLKRPHVHAHHHEETHP